MAGSRPGAGSEGPEYAPASGCRTVAPLNPVLILFSAISFLGYGSACFFSAYLEREFVRYGLGAQRRWVGVLQVSAALGLLAGLEQAWMGRAAAAGLAVMMLVAVGVRIRIGDSFLRTLPALVYLLLNAYLALVVFQ